MQRLLVIVIIGFLSLGCEDDYPCRSAFNDAQNKNWGILNAQTEYHMNSTTENCVLLCKQYRVAIDRYTLIFEENSCNITGWNDSWESIRLNWIEEKEALPCDCPI